MEDQIDIILKKIQISIKLHKSVHNHMYEEKKFGLNNLKLIQILLKE